MKKYSYSFIFNSGFFALNISFEKCEARSLKLTSKIINSQSFIIFLGLLQPMN